MSFNVFSGGLIHAFKSGIGAADLFPPWGRRSGWIAEALSDEVVWHEAENFPYADGNPYIGPGAVMQGVFARLGAQWEEFAALIDEFLDAGDKIVALGRYSGVFKETGKPITAQIVHVWTLAGGKVVAFQQYVDTLQVARAMEE